MNSAFFFFFFLKLPQRNLKAKQPLWKCLTYYARHILFVFQERAANHIVGRMNPQDRWRKYNNASSVLLFRSKYLPEHFSL